MNEERAGADQSVRLSVVLEPVIFLSIAGAFEWMVRARRARCDFLPPRGTDGRGRRTRYTTSTTSTLIQVRINFIPNCVDLIENGSKL